MLEAKAEHTPPFGQWLREQRKALDLTQSELAREVGCSQSTIRKIEAGILRPSRQVAELLAGTLQVPPTDRPAFVRYARGVASHKPQFEDENSDFEALANPESKIQNPKWDGLQLAAGGLPTPPTPLVGRRGEVDTICVLLRREDVRLVTLTGPPGSGKTRLSIQVANVLDQDFTHGVWFVPLAPVTDPDLVITTIASVLGMGIQDIPDGAPNSSLGYYLQDKRMLLVLDNFEQVVDAAVYLAELMEVAPGVKVLATSREELDLRGEKVFPVPPLELPPLDPLPPIEALAEIASVALFVQRAQDGQSDFALGPDNATDVGTICHRVEGLPLAIELAAARIPLLTPAMLSERLKGVGQSSPLRLLSGGLRDLPPRQRTLRDAISWSYGLLTPEEQCLFRRLSVFAGGCTLEAVEAVSLNLDYGQPEAAHNPNSSMLDTLDSLRAKSLLRREDAGGESRYYMLEMMREFAGDSLVERREEAAARQLHAEYYLTLAEEAAPLLQGPEQTALIAGLDREHPNMRAALQWFLDRGCSEAAGRLAADLAPFWHLRGYWSEGRRWIDMALALGQVPVPGVQSAGSPETSDSLRASLLHQAGTLAYRQGDYQQAIKLLSESEALWRRLDDGSGLAETLLDLGLLGVLRDEYEAAEAALEEALALFQAFRHRHGVANALHFLAYRAYAQGEYGRSHELLSQALLIYDELGDELGVMRVRHHLSLVVLQQGDFERAEALNIQNLAANRELGNKGGTGGTLARLAMVTLTRGDYVQARRYGEESVEIFRSIGARNELAIGLFLLGMLSLREGCHEKAIDLCRESLRLLRPHGAPYDIAGDLITLGGVASAMGDQVRAVRLTAAALALVDRLGSHLDRISYQLQAETVGTARKALGEDRFQEAWNEGQAMSINEACAYAL